MIINASGRTDIAHYYSEWLMNRIRAGWVLSRNPLFSQKISCWSLEPGNVDALLFCTKDPRPMLKHLDELNWMGFSVIFYITMTCYGKDLEPNIPHWRDVAEVFPELSRQIGRNRLFWRYDPLLLYGRYTVEHHLRSFREMAEVLVSFTDVCIFSFVDIYRKLSLNFPDLNPVSDQDRENLLAGLSSIASEYGLRLQSCGDSGDYMRFGISPSGCATAEILEKALGRRFRPIHAKPARSGCRCIPSCDIGAYDTCPGGCRYCYATRDRALSLKNYREHDPFSPLLTGRVNPGDVVIKGQQRRLTLPSIQQQFSLLD